jgi:DnaJ-class molecular chaperone with C-terminal Zn finger domain
MPTPNLNSEDYYQILGVDRNADDSQLKKAYRKLAVKVSELELIFEKEVVYFHFKNTHSFEFESYKNK